MPQISLHMSATSSQTMRQQGAYYGSPAAIPYGSVMLMNKEQEDLERMLDKPLETFGTDPVDELKNKYDDKK